MKFDKNILITGGLGAVSTGFLSILEEQDDFLKDSKIFIMDIQDEKNIAPMLKELYQKYGIEYIQADYRFNLEDVLYNNNIGMVIHLIPMGCLPVLNACEKMPWKMLYLDCSVYISNYSTSLDSKKHLLLSNFKKFDEIKGKYKNILGLSSCGMNPGITNLLWDKFIKENEKELGIPLAAYMIEDDNYRVVDGEGKGDYKYCTWGREAFYSECMESSFYFRDGKPIILKNSVACDNKAKFTMDGETFYGAIVIHEECSQLAKRYNCETAFLYSFPKLQLEGCHEYLKSFDDDEIKVMSPMKHKLEGRDKAGIKLVYKNKEINYVNENSGNKYVTGVSLQVSWGLYIAYKTVLKAYNENIQLPSGVDWIDEWIKNKDLADYMYDCLKLEFKRSENKYEGLILDRIQMPDEELEIAPDFKIITDKKEIYTFEDFYWKDFEDEIPLTEDDTDEEDAYYFGFMNAIYPIVSKIYENKSWKSYDEGFSDILNEIEKQLYIVQWEDYEFRVSNLPQLDEISISEIEAVLLEEGALQHNISDFLQNNFADIFAFDEENVKYKHYQDVFDYAVNLYEMSSYYDYIR